MMVCDELRKWAKEIENLATKDWLGKPNAEFLFTEITDKARAIQAWIEVENRTALPYQSVWIVEQDGRVHSCHATREHALTEKGERLRMPENPWGILG
jgi:hypothetical protein